MILNKTKIFLPFISIFLFMEVFLFFCGFKISLNISPSLSYKLFIVNTKKQKIDDLKNGDFIQFINKDAKYYSGVKITKQILAKSGDILDVNIFQEPKNNIQATIKFKDTLLEVKNKSMFGTKIFVNRTALIPENKYFVIGYDKNSFDSRYEEFGLIDKKEIIGVAKPIF